MDASVRICVGAFCAVAGGIGLVSGIWKRALLLALFSLAYAVLGIVLMLRLYEPDRVMGAIPVLIGVTVLVDGVKARSSKGIFAAIALVAAGAGVLAGLIPFGAMFGGFMAVFGGWGLARAIRTRAAGGISYYGGATAMGTGFLLLSTTRLFTLPFVLTSVGSAAAVIAIARYGWRIPWSGQQPSPSPATDLNTEN